MAPLKGPSRRRYGPPCSGGYLSKGPMVPTPPNYYPLQEAGIRGADACLGVIRNHRLSILHVASGEQNAGQEVAQEAKEEEPAGAQPRLIPATRP